MTKRSTTFSSLTLFVYVLSLLMLLGCPDTTLESNGGPNNTTAMNNPNTSSGSCTNTCIVGETDCLSESVVKSCVTQSDGCRGFGAPKRCARGEVCSAGKCMADSGGSSNQCSSTCVLGAKPKCSGNAIETCADHDNDGCLSYGAPQACGAGEVCSEGACMSPQCDQTPCELKAKTCEGDQIRVCQEIAGCLVFGPAQDCAEGKTCSNGACVAQAGCEDECVAGEKLCSPSNGTRLCEDGDNDECVEFVDKDTCASGQECRQGACVAAASCESTCAQAGKKSCDGSAIFECTDDGQGCLTRTFVEECATSGQVCQGETSPRCAVPPQSGSVVINEVLYDVSGNDVFDPRPNDGIPEEISLTFVELSGPPGFDVSGWEVRFVNGKNGQTYTSATLPPSTTLDGRGMVLVVTDKPSSYFRFTPAVLLLTATSTDDGIQNGPDNIELYDASGTKRDALGYGDFAAEPGLVFTGEGSAVDEPLPGRALGRLPRCPGHQ